MGVDEENLLLILTVTGVERYIFNLQCIFNLRVAIMV